METPQPTDGALSKFHRTLSVTADALTISSTSHHIYQICEHTDTHHHRILKKALNIQTYTLRIHHRTSFTHLFLGFYWTVKRNRRHMFLEVTSHVSLNQNPRLKIHLRRSRFLHRSYRRYRHLRVSF